MTFDELIDYAISREASDLHITVGTACAIRRFGELEILPDVPTAEESQRMILDSLNAEQTEKVLSGQDLDFALFASNGFRLRANIYHQRNNIAASYRILNQTIPSFEELEIPVAVQKLINEPRGLVLITGPTGSGKTTTMASMIDYINRTKNLHVMTIEDPIEYVYYHQKSMIHQREVGKDVDTFAKAVRSALREDPDIIMIGEMRDYETISAAITAAETGHLVVSTLHTTSAAQTIERILDAYPPHAQGQARAQLANVLRGVSTQILVPQMNGEGMVLATEVLLNNDAIAAQIRDNKTHQIQSTIQSNMSSGMHTLETDLKRLMTSFRISREDALAVANSPKELMMQNSF